VKEKAQESAGVKAVENSLKAYYKEVKKASASLFHSGFGNNYYTVLCCILTLSLPCTPDISDGGNK